jgi:hypothetical protein
MGNASEIFKARSLEIGAEAARLRTIKAGGHVGEARALERQVPTAVENLKARSLEIGAETARIQADSAEHAWICRREKPALLPDPEPEETDTNPLRRVAPGAAVGTAAFGETRLDYSAARPPANRRGD